MFASGQMTKGKTKTDDYVNGDNAMGEHTKAAMDQAFEAAKLSIPGLGKVALLLSGVSALAGLESEGITGKQIVPPVGNANGPLAQLAAKIKGKDLFAGVGGDARGEAASYGESASNGATFADLGGIAPTPIGEAAPRSGGGIDFA